MLDWRNGLEDLWDKVKIFDELYCTPMEDHPQLKNLVTKAWQEKYKDLEKLLKDDFCI